MRKAVLMFSCLLFLSTTANPFGQTKRKTKYPPKPNPFLIKESPCGVQIPTADVYDEELATTWRAVTASKESFYFYNTHRVTCGSSGVLSGWIKETYDAQGKSIASMARYEFKCRANQLRITSQTEYYPNGRVKDSETYKNADWQEVIPESIGERALEKLCHKKV